MFRADTKSTTGRASLRRVGGVDGLGFDPNSFGLVGNKGLELKETPPVQSCPDTLSCSDAVTDACQALHHDNTSVNGLCLSDDGLGEDVVLVAHPTVFFARQPVQMPFRGICALGLKPFSECQESIPTITNCSTGDNSAGGECKHIVFPEINTKNISPARRFGGISLNDEVEVETLLDRIKAQVGGLLSPGHKGAMEVTDHNRNFDAIGNSVERKQNILQGVSAVVIRNRRQGVEYNIGDRLSFLDLPIRFQALIGIAHAFDGLADHLRPKRGLFPDGVIADMLQGNSVPASVFLGNRSNQPTNAIELPHSIRQESGLFGGWMEFQLERAYHTLKIIHSHWKSKNNLTERRSGVSSIRVKTL